MKTVLIIVTQSNWLHSNCNESVALAMLLATFGHQVKVLLKDAALSLLTQHNSEHEMHQTSAESLQTDFNSTQHPFKPASKMVDSFEFYDLSPILIDEQQKDSHWLTQTEHQIEIIQFNSEFLAQFDHILYC